MTYTMSRFWTAYAVLSGPIVWFVHFVVIWAVAEMGCGANFTNLPVIPPATIRTVVIVATLAALAAVGWGGLLGWRHMAALRVGGVDEAETRAQFVFTVGMGLSAIFFVSILVAALPVFVLNACDTAV